MTQTFREEEADHDRPATLRARIDRSRPAAAIAAGERFRPMVPRAPSAHLAKAGADRAAKQPGEAVPALPGLGDAAARDEGWVILALRGDLAGSPRVEFLLAPDRATGADLAGRDAPACAVPVAIVANWGGRETALPAAAPAGRAAYFLTSPLEEMCHGIAAIGGDHPSARISRTAKLYDLACEIMDAFVRGELFAATGESELSAVDREQLDRARRLIGARFAEKLTIEQIARETGIGRAKLIRGFRELYGCSVHEMVTATRLRAAATALRVTRRPVSRIAFESGYQSSAAFARAFVRRYGAPPSLFRQDRLVNHSVM